MTAKAPCGAYHYISIAPELVWGSVWHYLLAPHGALTVIAFSYLPPTLLYSTTCIFSKYSPQTSENQSLEEVSNGLSVEASPLGPNTLHKDEMTPPPPLLDCTILYYTLVYIGVLYVRTSR